MKNLSAESKPAQRLHALDAVRGIALLLGIVLHATMSFQVGLAEQDWPIVDISPSTTLDVTFFVIHIFRMTVFFFIAGFFAHLVFHKRGARDFMRDRFRRIALPLVIFWPFTVATTGAIIVWAFWKLNGNSFPSEEPPATEAAGVPLTHLWFLYILLWLYVASLASRWLVVLLDRKGKVRLRVDSMVNTVVNSTMAAPIIAIPIFIALNSISNWAWWGGIPTPDQSLVPVPASLFIYFYIFCLGWLFDRQRDLLQVLKRHWLINFTLGAAMTVACLSITGMQSNFNVAPDSIERLVYAGCYAVAISSLSFAFLGAGIKFFSRESATMRYVADASYWVYIMHLTLVMFFQTLLMDVPLHWAIKFPLINLLTFIPLFLTYHWWVRSTRLGKLLNGKVYKKPAKKKEISKAQTA